MSAHSDLPLQNSDLVLFVDCSSHKSSDGVSHVSNAVCSEHDVLASGSLPAELVVLTEASQQVKLSPFTLTLAMLLVLFIILVLFGATQVIPEI